MHKLLYVAVSGASEVVQAQAVKANNLANLSTPGFRAELEIQRSLPVYGDGFPSIVYASTASPGNSFQLAGLEHTERPLDVALQGDGWFAVEGVNGQEGYTRRGDMQISPDGTLVNGANFPMLGTGGRIVIPPASAINVAADGVITITPQGATPDVSVPVGQLKLVNPDKSTLVKGEDGLFRSANGAVEADPAVSVVSGAIEASNVNAVGELIDLIALARKYELDLKMMKKADENDQVSARLLQLS